jgi:hypothetical protein
VGKQFGRFHKTVLEWCDYRTRSGKQATVDHRLTADIEGADDETWRLTC